MAYKFAGIAPHAEAVAKRFGGGDHLCSSRIRSCAPLLKITALVTQASQLAAHEAEAMLAEAPQYLETIEAAAEVARSLLAEAGVEIPLSPQVAELVAEAEALAAELAKAKRDLDVVDSASRAELAKANERTASDLEEIESLKSQVSVLQKNLALTTPSLDPMAPAPEAKADPEPEAKGKGKK
jgi:hypothetical protein